MASTSTKRPRPTRADAEKKKNNMSPEARQKLSELAKQRHAEGKFGGSKFGKLGGRGKTREQRLAQQSVAEAAQEHAEEIIEVFRDAIDPDRPMGQRLKGAELWLNVEAQAKKMQMAEERASAEQLDRSQLLDLLVEKLTSGPAAALLQSHQHALESGDVVDATVVE